MEKDGKIETDYDRLKNKLYIEKFKNRNRLRQIKKQIIHRKIQRKKTNHNQTRLLQPHIPIKPTNRNKTWRRTKNNTKTKRNSNIRRTKAIIWRKMEK